MKRSIIAVILVLGSILNVLASEMSLNSFGVELLDYDSVLNMPNKYLEVDRNIELDDTCHTIRWVDYRDLLGFELLELQGKYKYRFCVTDTLKVCVNGIPSKYSFSNNSLSSEYTSIKYMGEEYNVVNAELQLYVRRVIYPNNWHEKSFLCVEGYITSCTYAYGCIFMSEINENGTVNLVRVNECPKYDKVIIDGKVVIVKDGKKYDIMGNIKQ